MTADQPTPADEEEQFRRVPMRPMDESEDDWPDEQPTPAPRQVKADPPLARYPVLEPTPAETTAAVVELIPCYPYDFNQDGSEQMRGITVVSGRGWGGRPNVGRRVVLYDEDGPDGEGLCVVATITDVRDLGDGGFLVDTDYRNRAHYRLEGGAS